MTAGEGQSGRLAAHVINLGSVLGDCGRAPATPGLPVLCRTQQAAVSQVSSARAGMLQPHAHLQCQCAPGAMDFSLHPSQAP